MKSNLIIIFVLIFFNSIFTNVYSEEEFNFDVTELKILEDGNLFVGLKRGTVSNNNGIDITANEFRYDKKLNVLQANGEVKLIDKINNYTIETDKIIYYKKQEIINTENKSIAYSLNENISIKADDFIYKIKKNELTAKKNVFIENKNKNYEIYSNHVDYFKNTQKLFSKGETLAKINSKYDFTSSDITFFNKTMELESSNDTQIIENNKNLYKLSKFHYSIMDEVLKGENILINSNYILPNNEKFYLAQLLI